MSDNERKSHVERFFEDKENKEGAWIDVEIFDRLVFTRDSGYKWVETSHIFKELEEEREERERHVVQVKNPDDENQFVEIKVSDEYAQRGYPDKNIAYTTNRHYDNTDQNTVRQVDIRKIIHREIDDRHIDEAGQPPNDPNDYLDAINEANDSDDSQYVNFEVVHKYKMERGAGSTYQATWFNVALENSQLLPPENESQPDTDAEAVRLDVLQNIVNVSFAGLAVEFGNKADAPE